MRSGKAGNNPCRAVLEQNVVITWRKHKEKQQRSINERKEINLLNGVRAQIEKYLRSSYQKPQITALIIWNIYLRVSGWVLIPPVNPNGHGQCGKNKKENGLLFSFEARLLLLLFLIKLPRMLPRNDDVADVFPLFSQFSLALLFSSFASFGLLPLPVAPPLSVVVLCVLPRNSSEQQPQYVIFIYNLVQLASVRFVSLKFLGLKW